MFASESISENELLLEVPRSVLITAGDDVNMEEAIEKYGALFCPTVYNLIAEMRKGECHR